MSSSASLWWSYCDIQICSPGCPKSKCYELSHQEIDIINFLIHLMNILNLFTTLKDAFRGLSVQHIVDLKHLQPLMPVVYSAYHEKRCFCSCADKVD